MVTTANDPHAGAALCNLLDPIYGHELDVHDLTAHYDEQFLKSGPKPWYLLADAMREQGMTAVGYVSHLGHGYFNLQHSDVVECDVRDMVIVIGNFR